MHAETAGSVGLGPRKACTGPVHTGVVRPVFPRVEGKLLVVRGELPRKEHKHHESQDDICGRERQIKKRGGGMPGGPYHKDSHLRDLVCPALVTMRCDAIVFLVRPPGSKQ